MTDRGWLARASAVAFDQVADELGLAAGRLGSRGPCPACGAEKRGGSDGRRPIGGRGGAWRCFVCDAKGDVVELAARVTEGRGCRELDADAWGRVRAWFAARGWAEERAESPRPALRPLIHRHRTTAPASHADDEVAEMGEPLSWRDGLAEDAAAALWEERGAVVRAYLLEQRGFTEEAVREFGLGAIVDRAGEPWLTIPLRDPRGRPVNVRFRSVRGERRYRVCRGRPLPLFGADLLPEERDGGLIVCEGELDVVAWWQYGWQRGVVSGTAGATAEWPDEWLDLVEPYGSFTLALDDDPAGDVGAKKLADKLGVERCARVRLPRKDAGECLRERLPVSEVDRAVRQAQPMVGVRLLRVDAYGDELEALVSDPGRLVGRGTGSDRLDLVLGGLRPGLWVVTGQSGHGKTSLCHWLVYEQAVRGVPVALTSFEQRPIGSIQKLVRMRLGGSFLGVAEQERRAAVRELAELPVWQVDHYGHMPHQQVASLVRFAARRYGVRVFLVDHLGFMVPAGCEDERRMLEDAVQGLAETAVTAETTILLVVHPNREYVKQRRRVQLTDAKGAGAIEQLAHVGLVVAKQPPTDEHPWCGAAVHVDKCREEWGKAGATAYLAYDVEACTYADRPEDLPSARRASALAAAGGGG